MTTGFEEQRCGMWLISKELLLSAPWLWGLDQSGPHVLQTNNNNNNFRVYLLHKNIVIRIHTRSGNLITLINLITFESGWEMKQFRPAPPPGIENVDILLLRESICVGFKCLTLQHGVNRSQSFVSHESGICWIFYIAATVRNAF